MLQVVGQGGFGITYKGVWFTDVKGTLGTISTEVPVCIKEFFFKDYCVRDAATQAVVVHPGTGQQLFGKFREKLITEAKILSEVHYPYIVHVLEVFEENNTAYIVMEYISGQSLKTRLEREGSLEERTVLKYVRQVGEALSFVHGKHILHLDIKPSNIIIDTGDDARLIDFGVSKRYGIEQQETSTTMLTLSKGFASVEQYDEDGMQSFSPCADIYSLGATMYNLLTGKVPVESILRVARPLQLPRELNPAISQKTEAVIVRAMALRPSERYRSVDEMMAELDLPELPPKEYNPTGTPPANVPEGNIPGTPEDIPEETIVQGTGEETLVEHPAAEPAPVPRRRKPSRKIGRFIVVPAVVIAVAVAGISLFAGMVGTGKSTRGTPVTKVAENKEEPAPAPVIADDPLPQEPEPEVQSPPAETQEASPKEDAQPVEPAPREVAEPEPVQPTAVEQEKPEPAPESDSEADQQYDSLLSSGREKMEAEDFEGAKADFAAARDLKLTEEVVRLMIDCDMKAEEKATRDRIAQYEVKMSFGDYHIVRKKSTGLYGAIDADGYEKIPCRYLSVGIAEGGRAFEREDNLFDIYNPGGALVTEGATYY